MKLYLLVLPVLALSLTGCSLFNQGKPIPDEFAVVTKPPLVVPPEYNLQPPRPGESREEPTSQQARAALLGQARDTQASDAEQALVAKAGGLSANPAVRLDMDREVSGTVYKPRSFADRILFWNNSSGAPSDNTALDAKAEAERLEKVNDATGGGQVEITRQGGLSKLPGL